MSQSGSAAPTYGMSGGMRTQPAQPPAQGQPGGLIPEPGQQGGRTRSLANRFASMYGRSNQPQGLIPEPTGGNGGLIREPSRGAWMGGMGGGGGGAGYEQPGQPGSMPPGPPGNWSPQGQPQRMMSNRLRGRR